MQRKGYLFCRFLTLVIALLGLLATTKAQTGTIRGTVLDAKTNEPLIGASVWVVETGGGTGADLDGNFVIKNVPPGLYTLTVSYVAYLEATKTEVVVESGQETVLSYLLQPESYALQEVEVVAKANRESENILLLEQKRALLATQAIGAKEMSRKGIGNAESAVAQVSGISKQEGIKNVFVRGLGDRYNATLLNGFPLPSEDPEYKNIALEFFSSDMIQHIVVNKVFSGKYAGDVGGAMICLSSKELEGEKALAIEGSAGVNTSALKEDFLRQDGVNYLGVANARQPAEGTFRFDNKQDPLIVGLPVNHRYGLSGGKKLWVADNNLLSFFVAGSYTTDYSFTKESVRRINTIGTIIQDQTGNKFDQYTSQLLLANVDYYLNRAHRIAYNVMMVHATNQYLGEYEGMDAETNNDGDGEIFYRRQQANDNLLLTHQLLSEWKLPGKLKLDLGVAYNRIRGLEPDRRENYFSKRATGEYLFTAGNHQKRFFSELKEDDYNLHASLNYPLKDRSGGDNSALVAGYRFRSADNPFEAVEYNIGAASGAFDDPKAVKVDEYYNPARYQDGAFGMAKGFLNTYRVKKFIHSGYVDAVYQLTPSLTADLGFRIDDVDLTVDYHIETAGMPKKSTLRKTYFLPSLNLKKNGNDKSAWRLGVSKTYTLPQSKEMAPYQYVSIGRVLEGNPHIRPSDNYNLDLKWDFYPSIAELVSIAGFYKRIINPIARVDKGNAAGILTYDNVSDQAVVAGVEWELRKSLFSRSEAEANRSSKLSIGLNASYIYTRLKLDVLNTPQRNARLEGAAPFIGHLDLSYQYTKDECSVALALVGHYFSDRVYTTGTNGFKDIIEEGVPTLDFVSSFKVNKSLTFKAKANNLLDPSRRLVREMIDASRKTVISAYRKGIDISIGMRYDW